MTQDLIERKVRLSPEANRRWEQFEEENGVTMSAFLEAAALVQLRNIDGLAITEKPRITVYVWYAEVIRLARQVMKERRSRKPDDGD